MHDIVQSLLQYLIALPAIIIGLSFHEFAHAGMAYYLGDKTAYHSGRMTINPLAHLDIVGFLMMLCFHFGWAKPVPVNPNGFTRISQKKGMLLVALSGPMMNLLLAAVSMLLLRVLSDLNLNDVDTVNTILQLILPMISFNLMLAVFNLLPIPPLDGSQVLGGLLPDAAATVLDTLQRYGTILLLLLIFTGATNRILSPAIQFLWELLYQIIF